METVKNLGAKIKDSFCKKQSKTASLVIVLGCVGILFVFLSEFIPEDVHTSEHDSKSSFFETNEEELEKRLKNIISKINGAGKTEVMLTMDSSREYSYAINSFDDKNENEFSSESEIVIIEGENGEEPIIFKMTEAEIRGVLVICEGGENAVVREKIIEALCALLDIPSNKVSVAKMA